METQIALPGNLELRQEGGLRVMLGTFPYGTLATISDRGAVRKESFLPSALGYSIRDSNARIDVLIGHDWGKPIASRQSGTLQIRDTPQAVEFEATLPNPAPSWVVDMERSIQGGIMTGLSPGFRVPPRSAVPNAESIVPEPGNPGVHVRQIRQAVLREMSVLTSGAYREATVELRGDDDDAYFAACFLEMRNEYLAQGYNALLLPTAATLWR